MIMIIILSCCVASCWISYTLGKLNGYRESKAVLKEGKKFEKHKEKKKRGK